MSLDAMINLYVEDNCGIGELWGGNSSVCVSLRWLVCTRSDICNDAKLVPKSSHVGRVVPKSVVFLVSHAQ
jgi:hypothetical protein